MTIENIWSDAADQYAGAAVRRFFQDEEEKGELGNLVQITDPRSTTKPSSEVAFITTSTTGYSGTFADKWTALQATTGGTVAEAFKVGGGGLLVTAKVLPIAGGGSTGMLLLLPTFATGTHQYPEYAPWILRSSVSAEGLGNQATPSGSFKTLAAPELKEILVDSFRRAANQVFEPGIESELSKDISRAFASNGLGTLAAVRELLQSREVSEEVIAETLVALGRIESRAAHNARIALFMSCLREGSYLVRDGALLGLAFMNDPKIVPEIAELAKKESDPVFKSDLDQLIRQFL